jgi:hypothetical protein
MRIRLLSVPLAAIAAASALIIVRGSASATAPPGGPGPPPSVWPGPHAYCARAARPSLRRPRPALPEAPSVLWRIAAKTRLTMEGLLRVVSGAS